MNKPVFNYRAHKIMWAILANTGSRFKFEALEKMQDVPHPYTNHCYACSAQAELVGESRLCRKALCPLNWGDGTDLEFPCEKLRDIPYGGLYDEWARANPSDIEQRKAIAAKIRDLPLSKNARRLYTIIE